MEFMCITHVCCCLACRSVRYPSRALLWRDVGALEELWGAIMCCQGVPELVPLLDSQAPEVMLGTKL